MLKICCKMSLIFITGVLTATILLCAVYLIPVEPIQQHVRESMDIFTKEGENPFLLENFKGSSLDNYTDALMFLNASYKSENPFYAAAMLVERESIGRDQPIESLRNYIENTGQGEVVRYTRYWHGYLVVLKPLLTFMNYGQMRFLNGIFLLIVMTGLVCGYIKRKMWRGLVAFAMAFISLFPMTIPFSLQFSSMFYIGMFACMFLVWNYESFEKNKAFTSFFLIVGMMTSFMDFLTYPLFTFGMPMVLVVVMDRSSAVKRLKRLLVSGISWGIGYVGMWCSKWAVGSVLTETNLFHDAIKQVAMRVSHEVEDVKISMLIAILRNGYIFFNIIGIILAVSLIIWILSGSFRYRENILRSSSCLLLLLACMPIAWYCVAANHSYIHYWYTFRSLAVSVFAVGMIPEVLHRECGADEL